MRPVVALELLVLLGVAGCDVADAPTSRDPAALSPTKIVTPTAPEAHDEGDGLEDHGAAMGHAHTIDDLTDVPLDPASASVCADGPTVPGIDVSAWQGVIDWPTVAGSGIRFAVIRISDGTQYLDKYFDANWSGAQAAGLVVSAYQFFRPGQDAIAQAQLFVDTMGPLGPGILAPVIDIEDNDGLPPEAVAAQVGAWINHVEGALGVRPMIYTGKYFWNDSVGGDTTWSDYPLWIAQWGPVCPDLPNAWSDWLFHQTSATGSIPGIGGDVDTDLFNGDEAALQALANPAPPVCGDGKCSGGDEVQDTCPIDCPPCGIIPEGGATIDDVDACFRHEGDPESWYVAARGVGGSMTWTHAIDGDEIDHVGTWSLYFAAGGPYQVEAHVDLAYATSSAATYRIFGAAGEVPITVNFADADVDQDGWLDLGVHDFQGAGHGQQIRLDDRTGEPITAMKRLPFDAIRLTPPGVGTSGDDTDTDTATSSGGDTSDAGTSLASEGPGSASSDDPSTSLGDPDSTVGADDPLAEDGCGCVTDPRPGPRGALLGLLVLACGRRRR